MRLEHTLRQIQINRVIIDHSNVFPAVRSLFLYLLLFAGAFPFTVGIQYLGGPLKLIALVAVTQFIEKKRAFSSQR